MDNVEMKVVVQNAQLYLRGMPVQQKKARLSCRCMDRMLRVGPPKMDRPHHRSNLTTILT